MIVTEKQFSETPTDRCVMRLRLADNSGWISQKINRPYPDDVAIVEPVESASLRDSDSLAEVPEVSTRQAARYAKPGVLFRSIDAFCCSSCFQCKLFSGAARRCALPDLYSCGAKCNAVAWWDRAYRVLSGVCASISGMPNLPLSSGTDD